MNMRRLAPIVCAATLLHGAALWALNNVLTHPPDQRVVPVEMLVEWAQAPEESAATAPQAPEPVANHERPRTASRTSLTTVTAAPAPVPQAVDEPSLGENRWVAQKPDSAAMAPPSAPSTAAAGGLAGDGNPNPTRTEEGAGAPKALVLPSTDADYLNNPSPAYPPMSKRLREQGRVIIRTLIGADGIAQQAEIKHSSGFERLDQAALSTALRWRYVPGKRGGVAEAMWFNVPFTFILE